MVTLYEVYLWAHIFMAVIWVGGSLALQLLALRAMRSDDPIRVAHFSKDAEWVGMHLFAPASLLLVVSGFLLVSKADWGYPFWMIFAIAVWAASALNGSVLLGPESKRLGKLVEAHGVEDPEVQRRINRIFLVSRVELVLLIAVVFDMTIKPFN